MSASVAAPPALRPTDFLDLDRLLADEERLIRDTVRALRRRPGRCPNVGDWFEEARIPRELARRAGQPRAAGHAPGGLRLRRRERDGLRPRVHGARGRRQRRAQPRLRPGLAGDVRDPPLGLGGAEAAVAAADGGRRGDRLLRPDRARLRARTRARCARARAATARDWILNGAKMWITNGSIADVAVVWARDGRRRARLPGPAADARASRTRTSTASSRCARRSPPSWLLDDVRLPADAHAARGRHRCAARCRA